MIDYHLHTHRCDHAPGAMEDYLSEAERKGLLEMGFADHFPLELPGFAPESPVTMRGGELADYLADVAGLREVASIAVRAGVEVDYLPGSERVTQELLAAYSFDCVIGSIHFLDRWDFTHPNYAARYQTMDIDTLYEQYFATVAALAQCGLFDIVGHLDVVKKLFLFPRRRWHNLLADTCRVLARNGLCVELNTAGWRAPVGEAYLSEAFPQECLKLHVPVTLGSDIHRPEDMGSGLARAILLLKNLGFREIATFGRRMAMTPLNTR